MFWENLTDAEQDRLWLLTKAIKKWVCWSMENSAWEDIKEKGDKKKTEAFLKESKMVIWEYDSDLFMRKPPQPSDQDFVEAELLCMKGWKMETSHV